MDNETMKRHVAGMPPRYAQHCIVELPLGMLREILGMHPHATIVQADVRYDKLKPYLRMRINGHGYAISGDGVIPEMSPVLRRHSFLSLDWRNAEERDHE